MSVHVNSTRAATSDPMLPQVFGRYLLVQCLSRGGMGEIFLARHGLSGFEKLVVIKKVLPHLAEDQQFISRFIDEAQVAIKLQHANIAQVFEVGRVDDEYFLSLEYIDGRDLRRTLATLHESGRRFPPDVALFIAREVASGLSYAHRRTNDAGRSLRLVHCDISPPNVMLSFEGEIKVIDFGIAKSALRATATDPQMGFGKFGYMAPEQLIRGGQVDFRTDIYAAGVVLYELLTGERLYDLGDTPDYKVLARKVARGEHPLPSERDPSLAPFDHLVARALRPKPEERYQSAADMRDDIQHALVGINPTISSDNVAHFMRRLFESDLPEQQRLIARAAATDLEPWVEALTTQSATTVSYALAHMPLPAPATELVSRVPPPVPSRAPRRRPARTGWLLPVAAVGAVAAGSVFAWAMLRTERGEPVANAAPLGSVASPGEAGDGAPGDQGLAPDPAEDAPAAVTPTVTELAASDREEAAEPEPTSEVAEAAEVADEAPEPAPPPKTTRGSSGRRGAQASARPAKVEPPAKEPAKELSANAVHAKFRAVSKEYRDFKQSYGARLEKEWADLVTYAQFASSGDKLQSLDKKIDGFRSRMRSARN